MKLKKGLMIAVISILIFAMATTSFAVTAAKNTTSSKKAENSVSNEVENTVKNTVKNETKAEAAKSENKTTTKTTSKTETLNEDVLDAGDTVEYTNTVVKGNMLLAADKITLDTVKVDGDVIVFADEIEIIDSTVDGNILAAGSTITILGSKVTSVYAGGSTVRVDEKTVVDRSLNAAGETVTINAKVGRDVYVGAETVKFGDDAVVSGTAIVRAENKSISDDADIAKLDYDTIDTYAPTISVVVSTESRILSYIIGKGTEIAIILIITLFVLYCLPKFGEVNSALRLRDFFKAFFTGLLEFIVIIAIVVGLCFTVYGVGYALILLNLLILFFVLGKVIFIISFAVRMSCTPEKVSNVKAFFATVLVALVLALIEMISLAGTPGFVINMIINIILAFTGLGSMFRVFFTSKKALARLSARKMEGKYQEVPVAPVAPTPAPVETPVYAEPVVDKTEEAGAEELSHEVKVEIKEEIEELKEEREEEKKLEESASVIETDEEPKEEAKKEDTEKEDNKEEDDKEDK